MRRPSLPLSTLTLRCAATHTRGIATDPWVLTLQAIQNKEWQEDLGVDEEVRLAVTHAMRAKLVKRLKAEYGDDWDWVADAKDLYRKCINATASAGAGEEREKHLTMLVRAKMKDRRRCHRTRNGRREIGLIREAIRAVIEEHKLDPTDTPTDFLGRYKTEIDTFFAQLLQFYRTALRRRAINAVLRKYRIHPGTAPGDFHLMFRTEIDQNQQKLLDES